MTQSSNPPGTARIPLDRARAQLARIWFVGSGIIFLILSLQSILGKYGGYGNNAEENQDHEQSRGVEEAWAWFVPSVAPTLGLMLGSIGGAALGQQQRQSQQDQDQEMVNKEVAGTFYTLAWWLSVVYMLVLAATLLLEPFSPIEDPVKFLSMSNYWLGPLQGLTAAAIGVLFNSGS